MKKILLGLGLVLSLTCPINNVFAYADVPADSPYVESIDGLSKQGLIKGYVDNTFLTKNPISRAEFVKLVIFAKLKNNQAELDKLSASAENCFSDVPKEQWFAAPVCLAKTSNFVKGQKDGLFHPDSSVNLAEAAKILVQALDDETAQTATGTTSSIVSSPSIGQFWYSPFIENLANKKAIPTSIHYLNQELTRGEVAEMLWRLLQKNQTKPSTSAAALENSYCQKSPENIPVNLDMDKVRTTWLSWYNDVRKPLGLTAYTYDVQLERTAAEWSNYSKKRGFMDHKRPGQTLYYDYPRIEAWFKNLGLTFLNDHRVTFTENIGWGYYQCPAGDCTENMLKAIHTTFDFFISEKGKKYRAHYDSIINSRFKIVGIGLALNPSSRKYYLTVHYATAITSKPLPVCGRE